MNLTVLSWPNTADRMLNMQTYNKTVQKYEGGGGGGIV